MAEFLNYNFYITIVSILLSALRDKTSAKKLQASIIFAVVLIFAAHVNTGIA
jgi:hypothetical protein